MRILSYAALAAGILAGAATDASAAKQGSGGHSFSAPRAFSAPSRPVIRQNIQPRIAPRQFTPKQHFVPRTLPKQHIAPRTLPKQRIAPRVIAPKHALPLQKGPQLKHLPGLKQGPTQHKALVPGPKQNFVTPGFKRLPVFKQMPGSHFKKGIVQLPHGVKPKLSLLKPPAMHVKKFAPFVQRHWKKAFFFAAIAGIGYVTVPYLYEKYFYDTCAVNPDYDECTYRLSYWAVEDYEEDRVHYYMPSGATYRYRAEREPVLRKDVCSFEPFVERQWNRSFVWVQIPSVGNVTVPEDEYDEFYRLVEAQPPRYEAACKMLVREAANDTVMTSGLATQDFDNN